MRAIRHLGLPVAAALLTLCSAGTPQGVPHGRYVEARTAAVYAGACHYGGQLTTQGREAVVAWHFEGGEVAGVPLAGVDVVCAVVDSANLAESELRRSIVYVSESASPEQRRAAERLVRERYPELLGDVKAVRAAKIATRFDTKTEQRGYSVSIPGVLRVEGKLMPYNCCKMPLQVWYSPLAETEESKVASNTVFRFEERTLGPVWERLDENNGFLGRFTFGAH